VRHYVEAFEMRKLAQEMLAIFGGKMPHNCAIVPGGVTENPTVDKIAAFLWRLNRLRDFIGSVYLPDVLAVANAHADYLEIGAGPGNFLAYGVFDLGGDGGNGQAKAMLHARGALEVMRDLKDLDVTAITEGVKHSWYEGDGARHPSQEDTRPSAHKADGYSWIKSPRYDGKVFEVGPLANMLVSYHAGRPNVREAVDGLLGELNVGPGALNSVLGRHAARALEAKLVADSLAEWVLELQPGEPVCTSRRVPEEAEGMGLTTAPRGSLGHWIKIKNGVIDHYQLVVPTTWNASPKDEQDQPGPMEQALIGTRVRDAENPFELVRIIRSFDPCLACAVHTVDAHGNNLGALHTV
jgi:hydrogenase large subunit